MASEIRVSVVVPTVNRPTLLADCLNDLLNQDLDREMYEIIVVCDGPDTSTQKVVAAMARDTIVPVRFRQLPTRSGPAAARNQGWRSASGELIVFTDDDCRPATSWLSAFWAAYLHNKGNCAFTGKVIIPLPKPEQITDHDFNTQHLADAEFITANCACPKKILELTGGFDERFTMAFREDSDLQFNLLSNGINIKYIVEAIVVHPIRKVKWGHSLKEQRKGHFNALLYKKFPVLYQTRIGQAPPLRYYFMIVTLLLGLLYFAIDRPVAGYIHILIWLALWLEFSYQRLKFTSRTTSHILEMLATSAIIPFLSVYWHIRGLIRFRTIFF